jgi:2-aminoadipate transaminase
MSRMVAIKTANDSGTGALEQIVVAEYFSKHFQEHVDELSQALKGKLDTMVEAVAREFGTAVEPWAPKGGIFLWMKLPDEVDVRKLVQPALKAGVAFNPGPEWAVDGEASKSRLRLCFGLTTKEEIRDGVAAFARVCYEETGIPEQSGNIRNR